MTLNDEPDGKQEQKRDGEQEQKRDGEQEQRRDGKQEQERDGKQEQRRDGKQEQKPRPDPDQDLIVLDNQERLLHFAGFDAEVAWALGSRLRAAALGLGVGCTMEIEVAGQLLFACATRGAAPGQANWIRRKRNTVHHFARSTYAVGRKLERDGGTLGSRHGLPEADFVAHGGGFPLVLEGTGPVGTVVFSGLPQREDHNLVVEALSGLLGVEVPRLS